MTKLGLYLDSNFVALSANLKPMNEGGEVKDRTHILSPVTFTCHATFSQGTETPSVVLGSYIVGTPSFTRSPRLSFSSTSWYKWASLPD